MSDAVTASIMFRSEAMWISSRWVRRGSPRNHGMFSERSGVTNIALEGMILFGAAAAAITVERLEAPMLAADPLSRAAWIPWAGVVAGVLMPKVDAQVRAEPRGPEPASA